MIWNLLEFGTPVASTYVRYYPFAVNGYETLHEKTPDQIWDEFRAKPISYHIFVRAVNAFIFLFPFTFIIPKTISLFYPIRVTTHKFIDFSQQPWTYHHVQTLAGGLTLLLFFFTCIGFWKLFRNKKKTDFLWLITLSFFFCILGQGWIQPISRITGVPLVPMSMMIGFNEVLTKKDSKKWIKLIFVFAFVECILFAYAYSLNIEYTRQLAIRANDTRYDQLFTAYKLFFKS
jgi:hypothetical protein